MTKERKSAKSVKAEDSEEEVIKEQIEIQYGRYLFVFMVIYYGSWIVPGLSFMAYFMMVFRVNFLDNSIFISLFIELNPLLSLLFMPVVLIGCYIVHILIIGFVTKILWSITEKISPTKNGVIPRNIRSKIANYYHLRSFMLKYGKNVFTKGMAPWLSNWFFNFVGSSKIGKGTTIEESVGSDKFVDVGKNVYIGQNSTLASHLVQGIFGNISYFEIHVGDNSTLAAMNQLGPGVEVKENSYLLPLASCQKHSIIKGGSNYYFGIPLRKIFKKKIIDYLGIAPQDLERNEDFDEYLKNAKENKNKDEIEVPPEKNKKIKVEQARNNQEIEKEKSYIPTSEDLALDFTTSSAISRINIKFLVVYVPIFWLSGLPVAIYWYVSTYYFGLLTLLFLPIVLFFMLYLFILGILFFSKLLLILVNLIHQPKEGIFLAEIGNKDYEFWMIRKELTKIALWLIRNSPLPWFDIIAFKIFGVRMDSSSHLNDAWCDPELVTLGRGNLIGQGATIMSSMVIGKYLIIKRVTFGDYIMVGGHTTIAPGTIMGNDAIIGAISSTTFNQVLEPNWIYFGIPGRKLKENKYAEERRDIIIKRDVDGEKKVEVTHEVNIDEDKRSLIKTEDEEDE